MASFASPRVIGSAEMIEPPNNHIRPVQPCRIHRQGELKSPALHIISILYPAVIMMLHLDCARIGTQLNKKKHSRRYRKCLILWCRGTESNCRHGDFQTNIFEIENCRNFNRLILFQFFNLLLVSFGTIWKYLTLTGTIWAQREEKRSLTCSTYYGIQSFGAKRVSFQPRQVEEYPLPPNTASRVQHPIHPAM